jgi:hypothetical protein
LQEWFSEMKRSATSVPWFPIAGLLLGFALAAPVHAQSAPERVEASYAEPVAVYLDCKELACDHDFFKTEIPFVAHVRDRHHADVHVLISGQPTAAGGTEATLDFIGQNGFAGENDTLRYVAGPAEADDQIRQGLAGAIKRGLVRYVNRTAASEDLTILYTPSASAGPASISDPWSRWSFSVGVNGYTNGEELVSSFSMGGSVSANRTTESLKISTSAQTRYSRSTFEVGAGRTIGSVQRSHGFNALVVGSVNGHVSTGARVSAVSSSFLNHALTVRVAPAVEFNVFPFREATRRILTFEYSLGVNDFNYEEETIFGRQAERLLDQRLLVSLRLTQPWGSVALGAEASHYLHDLQKNRGIVAGSVDWNLARGLSLYSFANVQRVRDQLFLPRRGASDEEILLRQRQLATSYSYSASLGFSYTFGSRLANVVNRRFTGSVGGMLLQ